MIILYERERERVYWGCLCVRYREGTLKWRFFGMQSGGKNIRGACEGLEKEAIHWNRKL